MTRSTIDAWLRSAQRHVGRRTVILLTALLALAPFLTPWSWAVVATTLAVASTATLGEGRLPWLLRPAFVLMAPMAVLGLVLTTLAAEVQSAVGPLMLVVVAGMFLGMHLADRGRDWTVRPRPRLALALLLVSLLAASYFFVTSGIPLFADDVEQGRVDVATSGTGYVRLLAYLSIPAALVLICTGRRIAWVAPVLGFLIILGLANRSPILYLATPLALVVLNLRNGAALRIGPRRQAAFGVAVALMATAVIGLGAYRVVTQPEYRDYPEYSRDLEERNYVGVAVTAFTHYARVVPSNGYLIKTLVDDDKLPLQYGATYVTLAVTALPGPQDSLDMKVRSASGKEFVGGGIPPTLGGEGYANFGWPGVLLGGLAMGWLTTRMARLAITVVEDREQRTAGLAMYGYVIAWSVGAQVAGFAGASTFPMAGFLALCALMVWRQRK